MFRRATHAGSWYSGSPEALMASLKVFLQGSKADFNGKALITPHAGYDYSGPTAGIGYAHMDWTDVERVFILGPAHYVSLRQCAVSACVAYETPLGKLWIDRETVKTLEQTGAFVSMDLETDEEEHSIELQLPFLYYQLSRNSPDAKIVPILVGALLPEQEVLYGELLASHVANPKNRFVISSDFCHWGQRFAYTYYMEPGQPVRELSRWIQPSASYPIYASIEQCDREGMKIIEDGSHSAFIKYLSKTRNTICGRHPISVMLCALEKAKIQNTFKFIHYAQSSQCTTVMDSSVSYATAIVSH